MDVKATLATDPKLVNFACANTVHKKELKNLNWDWLFNAGHSPIRCLQFWVEMEDVPTFVSVHLVRHKIGVEHFVTSNRDDRQEKSNEEITRLTPVRHCMLINAEALIFISRRRLCQKAHKETIVVWRMVLDAVKKALDGTNIPLVNYCVPECLYRRQCPELKTCGFWNAVKETIKER